MWDTHRVGERGINIIDLRERLVGDYGDLIRGFLEIGERRLFISALNRGVLWPAPWVSFNPSFMPGGWIDGLVDEDVTESP